jgi:hypothetical protein
MVATPTSGTVRADTSLSKRGRSLCEAEHERLRAQGKALQQVVASGPRDYERGTDLNGVGDLQLLSQVQRSRVSMGLVAVKYLPRNWTGDDETLQSRHDARSLRLSDSSGRITAGRGCVRGNLHHIRHLHSDYVRGRSAVACGNGTTHLIGIAKSCMARSGRPGTSRGLRIRRPLPPSCGLPLSLRGHHISGVLSASYRGRQSAL